MHFDLNYTSAAAFRQHAEIHENKERNNASKRIVSMSCFNRNCFKKNVFNSWDSASSGCSVFNRSQWFGYCVQAIKQETLSFGLRC